MLDIAIVIIGNEYENIAIDYYKNHYNDDYENDNMLMKKPKYLMIKLSTGLNRK